MSENRLEARSLCSDLVKMEWKDEDGWMHEIPAVLEDISSRGACLQVESPVPVNTQVEIKHEDRWGARGRIIFCEFHSIGYFVGLEFPKEQTWEKALFRPQHLLDLQELVINRKK
jgi:hypothetical protein